MKHLTIKSIALAVVLSATALTANAMSTCSQSYRTYYLDSSCHYYYIDKNGNKVVDGRYDADALRYSGMTKKQDCNGRWYYEDSWGNKVYKSRRCS